MKLNHPAAISTDKHYCGILRVKTPLHLAIHCPITDSEDVEKSCRALSGDFLMSSSLSLDFGYGINPST